MFHKEVGGTQWLLVLAIYTRAIYTHTTQTQTHARTHARTHLHTHIDTHVYLVGITEFKECGGAFLLFLLAVEIQHSNVDKVEQLCVEFHGIAR